LLIPRRKRLFQAFFESLNSDSVPFILTLGMKNFKERSFLEEKVFLVFSGVSIPQNL
jgi:hypothetical protein